MMEFHNYSSFFDILRVRLLLTLAGRVVQVLFMWIMSFGTMEVANKIIDVRHSDSGDIAIAVI